MSSHHRNDSYMKLFSSIVKAQSLKAPTWKVRFYTVAHDLLDTEQRAAEATESDSLRSSLLSAIARRKILFYHTGELGVTSKSVSTLSGGKQNDFTGACQQSLK